MEYSKVTRTRCAVSGLGNQLGAAAVTAIENTNNGTIFVDESDDEQPWRFSEGRWMPALVAPPVALRRPDDPDAVAERDWKLTHFMVGAKGALFSMSASRDAVAVPLRVEAGVLTRWIGGKPKEAICEGTSPSRCFVTPDGEFWNAMDMFLGRLEGERWSILALTPGNNEERMRNGFEPLEHAAGVGANLRALDIAGPPWILLDREKAQLLKLAYEPDVSKPHMTLVSVTENAEEAGNLGRNSQRVKQLNCFSATSGGSKSVAYRCSQEKSSP